MAEFFDTFLQKHFPQAKKTGANKWMALCPAHPDRNPSLEISEGDDGRVLVHCYSGCTLKEIVGAMSLKVSDLFPPKTQNQKTGPKMKYKPKCIPEDYEATAFYNYKNAAGRVIYRVVRWEHPDPHKEKKFTQQIPDAEGRYWLNKGPGKSSRVLCRLPELLKAIKEGQGVYLCEGEKDCDNLAKLGLVATCNMMGAIDGIDCKKWEPQYTQALAGAHVVLLRDNDQAGLIHQVSVARLLYDVAASIRLLDLPGLPFKGDVSDWLRAGGTREQLEALAVESSVIPKQTTTDDLLKAALARYESSGDIDLEWHRLVTYLRVCGFSKDEALKTIGLFQKQAGGLGSYEEETNFINLLYDDKAKASKAESESPKEQDNRKSTKRTVELLDEWPDQIRRPLTLIGNTSYAGTWLPVRETKTEVTDKKGNTRILDTPLIINRLQSYIISRDGVIYGDGGDKPIKELGIDVRLPEIPPTDKLWSTKSIKRYKAGERPDPQDVFSRIVSTIDSFLDFDRSLADQSTMCELLGCYILAGWFLDGLNVIGYLWPNGDAGCGKTKLLEVVCNLSYLGMVILAGGSYASLRDLADYGATLAFDDAENIADPKAKTTDPDKRTLLLAGNRKGNTVPVKELAGDKVWRTRYVNTFCPRLFSAIKLPDAVLSSRSIVIPLIRTGDRKKAAREPVDYSYWLHDRRELIDDLWALALQHLPSIPSYDKAACEDARIEGRNLDTWRGVLIVAKWLEDHGVTRIYERMEKLSFDYQADRTNFETDNLTINTLKALNNLFAGESPIKPPLYKKVYPNNSSFTYASNASNTYNAYIRDTPLLRGMWAFAPSDIRNEVVRLMQEEGHETEWLRPDHIGRTMKRLRFVAVRSDKEEGNKRLWLVSASELCKVAGTYGVCLHESVQSVGSVRSVRSVCDIPDSEIPDNYEPGSYEPEVDAAGVEGILL